MFRAARTGDERLDRNLLAIEQELAALGAKSDASAESRSSMTVTGEAIVVFRGSATATVTLPRAADRAHGFSALLVVVNDSSVSVTIAASGGDKIGAAASVTLAAGAKTLLASNGVNRWHQVV